jgi:hypothetical protein
LSQKKSKSRKTNKSRKMNRKMSETARNGKKPRTIALGIYEPKLRGRPSGSVGAVAREDKPLRAVQDKPLRVVGEVARTETKPPAFPLSETMLGWSPWIVMLRQQAFVAHALSNMMRAQQQFARMLSGQHQFAPVLSS